jgi:glycosyltransferase involved in cell wall biosynthesis
MKLSVIIPYLNYSEAWKCETEIRKIYPDAEVIKYLGACGKGAALKFGSRLASGDIIVWLDADLQIHPRCIKRLLRKMEEEDAGAVIGNKRHAYSITHYTLRRRIVSNGYNALVRFFFGVSLRDTQCGIKAFRADLLKILIEKVRTYGYGSDLEIIVAFQENHILVVDAPVVVTEQAGGGSVSLKTIWTTFWETIRIWDKRRHGFYADQRLLQ